MQAWIDPWCIESYNVCPRPRLITKREFQASVSNPLNSGSKTIAVYLLGLKEIRLKEIRLLPVRSSPQTALYFLFIFIDDCPINY